MQQTQAKVNSVILQEPAEITIGGATYLMPHPTLGTLIMASEKIAELPDFTLDLENAYGTVLRNARDCRPIADIIAIFLLGAKAIEESRGMLGRCNADKLARTLCLNATPKEFASVMKTIMEMIDVKDFFSVTTFLKEINLTAPKKVVNETTASGR